MLQTCASQVFSGPDKKTRETERTYVWARAENEKGELTEGWLDIIEGYKFTAKAALRCVDLLFRTPLKGVLTPAMAFGADFVLEIYGSKRYDFLENIEAH